VKIESCVGIGNKVSGIPATGRKMNFDVRGRRSIYANARTSEARIQTMLPWLASKATAYRPVNFEMERPFARRAGNAERDNGWPAEFQAATPDQIEGTGSGGIAFYVEFGSL